MRRNVQLVGSVRAQHLAFAVAFRRHINLALAGLGIQHAFRSGDSLIEPCDPLIDLGDVSRFLIDVEVTALVPGRAGPIGLRVAGIRGAL
jgi:hypothetical protein